MCFSFSMNTIRAATIAAVYAALLGCGSFDEPAVPAAEAAAAASAATAPEHEHDAPAPPPFSEAPPKVPVLEHEVAYGEGARSNLVGYLAMPQDAAEPLPGIIVIHEWWGLNDNIKAMTRRLAGEGYVALAVDLYGGEAAETPQAARALMSKLLEEDPDAARNNLHQAYLYLEKYALAPLVASIGWDLGGGLSLQTALQYPNALDAMVMYYGQIVTRPRSTRAVERALAWLFRRRGQEHPRSRRAEFSSDAQRARQGRRSSDRAARRSRFRESRRR